MARATSIRCPRAVLKHSGFSDELSVNGPRNARQLRGELTYTGQLRFAALASLSRLPLPGFGEGSKLLVPEGDPHVSGHEGARHA